MRPGHATTTLTFLLFLGLAAASSVHAAKGYHLWYDENGQAVYSQFAPEDGTPSKQVKPPPPPAESPEVAQKRLQEQMQKSADFIEDRELTREKAAKTETQAELDRQRCKTARDNLKELSGPPNRLYRQSDGSYERLDEAERQRRRDEMEKIVAESCK